MSFSNAWKDDECAQQFFNQQVCGQNSPSCISYLSLWLALDSQGSQTGTPPDPSDWLETHAPPRQSSCCSHHPFPGPPSWCGNEDSFSREAENFKCSFLCKNSWCTCEISPDLNFGDSKQPCAGQRTTSVGQIWPFRLQPLPWMLYLQMSVVK